MALFYTTETAKGDEQLLKNAAAYSKQAAKLQAKAGEQIGAGLSAGTTAYLKNVEAQDKKALETARQLKLDKRYDDALKLADPTSDEYKKRARAKAKLQEEIYENSTAGKQEAANLAFLKAVQQPTLAPGSINKAYLSSGKELEKADGMTNEEKKAYLAKEKANIDKLTKGKTDAEANNIIANYTPKGGEPINSIDDISNPIEKAQAEWAQNIVNNTKFEANQEDTVLNAIDQITKQGIKPTTEMYEQLALAKTADVNRDKLEFGKYKAKEKARLDSIKALLKEKTEAEQSAGKAADQFSVDMKKIYKKKSSSGGKKVNDLSPAANKIYSIASKTLDSDGKIELLGDMLRLDMAAEAGGLNQKETLLLFSKRVDPTDVWFWNNVNVDKSSLTKEDVTKSEAVGSKLKKYKKAESKEVAAYNSRISEIDNQIADLRSQASTYSNDKDAVRKAEMIKSLSKYGNKNTNTNTNVINATVDSSNNNKQGNNDTINKDTIQKRVGPTLIQNIDRNSIIGVLQDPNATEDHKAEAIRQLKALNIKELQNKSGSGPDKTTTLDLANQASQINQARIAAGEKINLYGGDGNYGVEVEPTTKEDIAKMEDPYEVIQVVGDMDFSTTNANDVRARTRLESIKQDKKKLAVSGRTSKEIQDAKLWLSNYNIAKGKKTAMTMLDVASIGPTAGLTAISGVIGKYNNAKKLSDATKANRIIRAKNVRKAQTAENIKKVRAEEARLKRLEDLKQEVLNNRKKGEAAAGFRRENDELKRLNDEVKAERLAKLDTAATRKIKAEEAWGAVDDAVAQGKSDAVIEKLIRVAESFKTN